MHLLAAIQLWPIKFINLLLAQLTNPLEIWLTILQLIERNGNTKKNRIPVHIILLIIQIDGDPATTQRSCRDNRHSYLLFFLENDIENHASMATLSIKNYFILMTFANIP